MPEGFISQHLNRKLSRPLARLLVQTPITPNFVSFLSFIIGIGAGLAFLKGQGILGGILAQIASVMDGVDGDLARFKGMESPFGAFFDAVLDRYADAAIILGMTWFVSRNAENLASWFVGLMALVGSFMVSYSWAKAEASLHPKSDLPLLRLAGRDSRLFLIMIGGVLNLGFWTLLLLAVLTHLAVLVRILYFARVFPQPKGQKSEVHVPSEVEIHP